MDGWYYRLFDADFGPVTFDELVELVKNNTFLREDLVRFGKEGPWRQAGSIGPLMAHFPFQAAKHVVSKESPTKSGLRWWCLIQDKEYGPIEYSKVLEWVEKGRIHPDDYLRCGREAYRHAYSVTGLFPERPKSSVETKSDVSTMSGTQSRSVARSKSGVSGRKSTSEAAIETWLSIEMPAWSPKSTVEAVPIAPTPSLSSTSINAGQYGNNGGFGNNAGFERGTNSRFGSGRTNGPSGGGAVASNRPMTPIRRPSSSSKSSGNIIEILTGPLGLGTGGTILAASLIYFALPYLPLDDSANAKLYKKLRAAVTEVTSLRNDDNVRPEQFKPLQSNLEQVANSVLDEVKDGTAAGQKKLKSLARKVQEMAKADLAKPSDAEKAVNTQLIATAKELNVN